MGLRYRKSINLGCGFRINLSKSGIGYSWGTKGFRITKSSNKNIKKYSIPNTGISYIESNNAKNIESQPSKPNKQNEITIGSTTYYKSENMDEMSKNDIILKKIKNIETLNRISNIFCMSIIFLPIGVLVKIIIAIFGRINLEYEFDSYSIQKYEALNKIINKMKMNQKMWRVTTSTINSDLKYSSGATHSIARSRIELRKGIPIYLKTNIDIYYIKDNNKKIYLTPDRIIIIDRRNVFGCKYNNLDFNIYNSKYIEEDIVPKDAKIISYTWKYINKNGDPDRRFKNNRKLPICDYGGLSITSKDGINFKMQCSNIEILAEATEYINEFVDIVNKEIESENSYYNFEENNIIEDSNYISEKYNLEENNLQENKKDEIKEKVKYIKEDGKNIIKIAFKSTGLIILLFFLFTFCLISFLNEMPFVGILWIVLALTSIYTTFKKEKIFKVVNCFAFVFVFGLFIIFAPKEYDGTYKSNLNNSQIILNKNNAEIILDDGTNLNGKITYKMKGNLMEIKIRIKDNDIEYNYIYDTVSEKIYNNEQEYYKER